MSKIIFLTTSDVLIILSTINKIFKIIIKMLTTVKILIKLSLYKKIIEVMMSKKHYGIYGNVTLMRVYCKKCRQMAFIIDGKNNAVMKNI